MARLVPITVRACVEKSVAIKRCPIGGSEVKRVRVIVKLALAMSARTVWAILTS